MGRTLSPLCTKLSGSKFKVELGALVSRAFVWSSGGLSSGPGMVAAAGEGVVAGLAAQVLSEGLLSLSWAPEIRTCTKNPEFRTWWYQVKKASLLWGRFKVQHCGFSHFSMLVISIKAQGSDASPLCQASPNTWVMDFLTTSCRCKCVYAHPRTHTHTCPAARHKCFLFWAFQRDRPAGHEAWEFERSFPSSSFS